MAADIPTTAAAILDCACQGLTLPVCECGQVIGSPMIGGCCDECDGTLTLDMVRVFPADSDLNDEGTRFAGNCLPGRWAADFELSLSRCYPLLDETGNVPDLADTTAAAVQLELDAADLIRSLSCCTVPLRVGPAQVLSDPLGGCSALLVTVTAQVSVAQAGGGGGGG